MRLRRPPDAPACNSNASNEARSRFARRRGQRGVAMVMAVTTVGLLTYLAMQIMYESTVEYTVNSQSLNRLKAYYAARSGLELSLLRIKIYQTVMTKYGSQMGPYQQYVDEIWKFPLAWPLPMPEELNSVDKESAEKVASESLIDTSFVATIGDEGSKVDLNDLVSPSTKLRELTENRLLEALKRKVEDDDEWRDKYGNFRFEELVNNIADWMSDKRESRNGGDKRSDYADLNRDGDFYPPNAGFRTLGELRMVKDMNDDFYDFLVPIVTIYGMRGVNPNVASKEVIRSLDAGLTDEIVDEIIQRRDDPNLGGPFKDAADFWGFVQGKGARLVAQDTETIPLYFESLVSFRIRATGSFASSVREIEVVTMDLDRTAKRIKEFTDKEKELTEEERRRQEEEKKKAEAATSTGPAQVSLSKGPPRIVFWSEK